MGCYGQRAGRSCAPASACSTTRFRRTWCSATCPIRRSSIRALPTTTSVAASTQIVVCGCERWHAGRRDRQCTLPFLLCLRLRVRRRCLRSQHQDAVHGKLQPELPAADRTARLCCSWLMWDRRDTGCGASSTSTNRARRQINAVTRNVAANVAVLHRGLRCGCPSARGYGSEPLRRLLRAERELDRQIELQLSANQPAHHGMAWPYVDCQLCLVEVA